MRKREVTYNQDQETREASNPLHVLLAATLERAVRDLTHSHSDIRRSTVWWFLQWRNTPVDETGISFKDIVDVLNLEDFQVQALMVRVRHADSKTETEQ